MLKQQAKRRKVSGRFTRVCALGGDEHRGQWWYKDSVTDEALSSAQCVRQEEVDNMHPEAKANSDTWLSCVTLSQAPQIKVNNRSYLLNRALKVLLTVQFSR